MIRTTALATLIFLAAGSPIAAETPTTARPSDQEQTIWAQEVAYLNHLIAGQLDEVEKYWHEKFVGWPSHSPAPVHRDSGRRSLEGFLATSTFVSVRIDRKAITIVDNLAVVHYVAVADQKMTGGQLTRVSIRITHTWLETPEGWKIIGGMSSS